MCVLCAWRFAIHAPYTRHMDAGHIESTSPSVQAAPQVFHPMLPDSEEEVEVEEEEEQTRAEEEEEEEEEEPRSLKGVHTV